MKVNLFYCFSVYALKKIIKFRIQYSTQTYCCPGFVLEDNTCVASKCPCTGGGGGGGGGPGGGNGGVSLYLCEVRSCNQARTELQTLSICV